MKRKFDLIIANPPYAQGNVITRAVLDNIEFDEYINLMPLTSYSYADLSQHIINVLMIDDSVFDGVTVPSLSLVKLTKQKLNNNSALDTLIELNVFGILSKYLGECRKRFNHKVIRGAQGDTILELIKDYSHNFFLPTFNYKVYRSGNTFEANVNNNVELLIKFVEKNNCLKKGHGSTMYTITDLSVEQRNNISQWYYSSSFISLVLPLILKCDIQPFELIPSVDWTHEWTDEEILKEYGYTDDEIKEVLNQARAI